jgi:hypothetical protein
MQETEDTLCAQLQNEMCSVKLMKVRGEHYSVLQKRIAKAEERCCAELWNEMCPLQMMMPKAEEICRTPRVR